MLLLSPAGWARTYATVSDREGATWCSVPSLGTHWSCCGLLLTSLTLRPT